MNKYEYNDIFLGMQEQFKVNIDQESMNLFAKLSGDYNPVHVDNKFAQQQGYNQRIVYGLLASFYYSKLIGVYLPGIGGVENKCYIDFMKPVYIGDTLKVIGKIIDKRDSTKRIKIKGTMINQNAITVNKAIITK